MPKNILQQSRHLKELIETEETYGKNLDLFSKVLESAVGKYTSKLKPLIDSMLKTSIDIISNLKDSLSLLESDDVDTKQRIGLSIHRFSLLKTFFIDLGKYTPLQVEITKMMKANPQIFADFDAQIKPDHMGGFSSLLIQPVQRGPRYQMLLTEIVKIMRANPDQVDKRQMNMVEGLLEEIIENMTAINKATPVMHDEEKPYQFGDITRRVFSSMLPGEKPSSEICFELVDSDEDDASEKKSVENSLSETPNVRKGYKLGDISKAVYTSFFGGNSGNDKEDIEPTLTNGAKHQ